MTIKQYDLQKKDSNSFRLRTFRMFLTGILILNVLFIATSCFSGDPVLLCLFHIMYGILTAVVLFVLVNRFFFPVAAAFLSLTQFIVLPVLFITEGGLLGPIPIWMAFHTVFLFLFFKKKTTVLFMVITVCEYSLLFNKLTDRPELIRYPAEALELWTGSLFALISAGGWLMMFLLVQQRFLDRERKKVRENEDKIRRSGIMKNHFLNDLSLEMRQPVTSIIGMCELVLKQEQDHLIHEEMEKIRLSCYDILSIVDDTISYSRLGLSDDTLKVSAYRFDQLLSEVVDSVTGDFYEKKLRFDVIAHADIPKNLVGDAKKIKQIFRQVLLASLFMTTEGRIQLEVWAQKDKGMDTVRLTCRISDTGRGMRPQEAAQLFRHHGIQEESGSGLEGIEMKLNICREYLETMNGSIHVDTLLHVGTAVTFQFCNQFLEEEPIASVSKEKKLRILCYENEVTQRQSFLELLKELGLYAEVVHNRYRFECAVRDRKFDYIFISRPVYESLQSIITYYHCESETYVIADYTNVFGDFGKCRLVRTPLYSVKIAELMEGGWKEEDYRYSGRQGSFKIKHANILVVDNHAVDLKVATGIFSNYGVNIDIAVSGSEGLKKSMKEKYHLILTNLLMPKMSGYELLDEIRSRKDAPNYETPIAAVSSMIGENRKEAALAQGFQFFIAKPMRIKDIEECLIRFIPHDLIQKKEKAINPETRKEEFNKNKHGLDVAAGLSNIGNNEESYAAVLGTYYTENRKKQENLGEIFKKEDLFSFISAVHSIKSASAGIGALRLSALARELEFAGKDGEISVITERLPLFLKEYQLILDEIEDYLKKHGKLPECKEERTYNTEEQKLEHEALLQLKAELDRMDLKASALSLTQLTAVNYGEKYNEELWKLKQACDRFDFHIAKQIVSGLLADAERVSSDEGEK